MSHCSTPSLDRRLPDKAQLVAGRGWSEGGESGLFPFRQAWAGSVGSRMVRGASDLLEYFSDVASADGGIARRDNEGAVYE
jgi:hypothetical protein